MSPAPSNPSWGLFPPFMAIMKFVSNVQFGVILRSDLQETAPVSDKVEDLISRVISLEELFGTPVDDVAEQGRRKKLIRYPIVPPFEFPIDIFLGGSIALK